jgi:hypothetical protein
VIKNIGKRNVDINDMIENFATVKIEINHRQDVLSDKIKQLREQTKTNK